MAECGCKPKDEYLHLDPEVDSTACQYAAVLRRLDESLVEIKRLRGVVLKVESDGCLEISDVTRDWSCRGCGSCGCVSDSQSEEYWRTKISQVKRQHSRCQSRWAREALSTPQHEVKK